jgi:hypothetical protein
MALIAGRVVLEPNPNRDGSRSSRLICRGIVVERRNIFDKKRVDVLLRGVIHEYLEGGKMEILKNADEMLWTSKDLTPHNFSLL